MKRIKPFCLLLLCIALLLPLVSCSSTKKEKNPSFAEKLYQARLDYVGDNSGVGNLVDLLGFGDFGPYTITLHTKEEPYGLTILYNVTKNKGDNKDRWLVPCSLLLGLIKNLSQVEVITSTDAYIFSKDNVSEEMGFDIKTISSSQEKLGEYLKKMDYSEGPAK